jgi:hypothetical protein
MSFDIFAISGDIELGRNGDVARVTDSDKLAQEVIKLLNTTIGSDPLNPNYGSLLTSARLGSGIDVDSIVGQTQAILTEALEQLVQLQEFQSSFQTLTDAETIVGFEPPIVELDDAEPRQFNVMINALSRDLTPLTIAFVARF